jgi:hypothetical protein
MIIRRMTVIQKIQEIIALGGFELWTLEFTWPKFMRHFCSKSQITISVYSHYISCWSLGQRFWSCQKDGHVLKSYLDVVQAAKRMWTRQVEEVRLVLASQNDGSEAQKAEGTRFKWSSQFPWWRRLTGALSGVGETHNASLPPAPREPTHEKWKLFAPQLRDRAKQPGGGGCCCREHSVGRRVQHISPGM